MGPHVESDSGVKSLDLHLTILSSSQQGQQRVSSLWDPKETIFPLCFFRNKVLKGGAEVVQGQKALS